MKELNTKETIKKDTVKKNTIKKEKVIEHIIEKVIEPIVEKNAKIDNEIKGDITPIEDIIDNELIIEEKEGVNYKGIVARGEFFIINGERFREALDAAKYNYKINGAE